MKQLEKLKTLNTLFVLVNKINPELEEHSVIADSKVIISNESLFAVENGLHISGKYKLQIDGELKFTTRQKWDGYTVDVEAGDNKAVYTLKNNKDETLTISFIGEDIKDFSLPVIPFTLISSNGSKLFNYKFIIDAEEQKIAAMDIKTSNAEKFMEKADFQKLKKEQVKLKLLTLEDDKVIKTDFISGVLGKSNADGYIPFFAISK